MSARFRDLIRYLLDRSLAPLLRYSIVQIQRYKIEAGLYELAWRRAIRSSLQYADENMPSALMFRANVELWNHALSKISLEGICAEFGVWKGRSINYFAEKVETIYGFDSFEGLQEDWRGTEFAKGTFDLQGRLPKVARNVRLIKGCFNDTVPKFLQEHPEPFSFVHIDCDTFQSTTLVLNLIERRLVPGTVVIFDEYFGYRGWATGGEFKAWSDYVQRTCAKYEYLAFSSQQVAIRLLAT